jgi:hypothetical protein
MKATYRVHSVGPHEITEDVTLASGMHATALVRRTVVELVPTDDSQHGTITLLLPQATAGKPSPEEVAFKPDVLVDVEFTPKG